MSTANIEPATASTKLPLWELISRSYGSVLSEFGDVMRMSWAWLLVGVPLAGYLNWLNVSFVLEAIRSSIREPSIPPHIYALSMLGSLIVMMAALSIAVAWHRKILLDERPALAGLNIAQSAFWRYLGVGLKIALVAFAPMFLIVVPLLIGATLGLPSTVKFGVLAAIFFLAYLASSAALLRLMLLMPARAIGDTGLSITEAWERTRGNCWRLFWGLLACTLPPLLPALLLQFTFIGVPSPGKTDIIEFMHRASIAQPFFLAYYLLTMPVCISFMSYAYQHFLSQPRIR